MANVFKNAKLLLSASVSDIYTVSSSTTAIVIGSHVTNISNADQTLDFLWSDSSDSNNETYLANAIVVPQNAAYEPVGKLVLEAGDKLRAKASASATLEVTVSVLEQS